MRLGLWKLSYAVGHFLNDVCATVWFSYTLLFFQRVLCFPSHLAGAVVLTGQVADAISTVFVGLVVDRSADVSTCRYGRRKVWHLIGTVCVLATFVFIFSRCVVCNANTPRLSQLAYYAAFACVFQFGWAAVQISHLSLIPVLTSSQRESTELNALRYGFTVCANILVYVVAWGVLGTKVVSGGDGGNDSGIITTTTAAPVNVANSTQPSGNSTITVSSGGLGPSDIDSFRVIVISTMAVGVVTTLIFHVFTKERTPPSSPSPAAVVGETSVSDVTQDVVAVVPSGGDNSNHSVCFWLRRTHLWMLSVVYMSVRLYVNLSMTYITLYMHDYLRAPKTAVAVIPLVMYVGGFCGSLLVKLLGHRLNRRAWLAVGALLGIISSVGVSAGSAASVSYSSRLVYLVTVVLGCGGSIMLVTALATAADVIGKSSRGAFVYGALSFCDKLSNGIVVEIIQNVITCTSANEQQCGQFYRDVLAALCGGACVVVLLVVVLYRSVSLWQHRSTDENNDENNDDDTPHHHCTDNAGGVVDRDSRATSATVNERSPLLNTAAVTSPLTSCSSVSR